MLRNWGRGHAEDPTGQRPAELVFVLGGGLEHTHVYATSHSYPAVCKAKCSADRSPFNEGKCGGSSDSDRCCLETEHELAKDHFHQPVTLRSEAGHRASAV